MKKQKKFNNFHCLFNCDLIPEAYYLYGNVHYLLQNKVQAGLKTACRLMSGATHSGSQESSNMLPKMTLFLLKAQCNREFF